MKIPDKIRIGGIEYTIIHESRLNDGQGLLAGQIRPMDCVIALAADSNHEYKCLTLWHEICTALRKNFRSSWEKIVNILSKPLPVVFIRHCEITLGGYMICRRMNGK